MIYAFPIGIEKETRRTPWLTYFLILMNLALYVAQYLILPEFLAKRPELLFEKLGFLTFDREPWRALTYSFLHATLYNFFINMLLLFLMGMAVEDLIGWWKTALIYLLGALGGAVLNAALIDPSSRVLLIGSLAPVTALAAAALVMMPRLGITIGYGYWLYFWVDAGSFVCPAIVFFIFYLVQAHLPMELLLRNILPILRRFSILRDVSVGFSPAILWSQIGGIAVGIIAGITIKGLAGFQKVREQESVELAEEIEKKRFVQEQDARKPTDQRVGLEEILAMPDQDTGDPPDPALLALLVSSKQAEKAAAEYTNWLRKDPRASLAPEPQTDLARLLIEQGAHELALLALINLIDKYPKTQHAKAALLTAGEAAALIPSKRAKAFGFLNRFLATAPSRADQEKAMQLLGALQQDLLLVDTQEFGIDLDADFSEKTRKVQEQKEAFFRPALSESDAPLALNLTSEIFGPADRKETLAGQPVEEKRDDAGPISLDQVIAACKREEEQSVTLERERPKKPNIPPPPDSIEIDPNAAEYPDSPAEQVGQKQPPRYNLRDLPPARGGKVSPPPVLFSREEMEELVGPDELHLDIDTPEFADGSGDKLQGPVYTVLLRHVNQAELAKAIKELARLTRRTPESLVDDPAVRHGILLSRISKVQAESFGRQLTKAGVTVLAMEDPMSADSDDAVEARELRVDGSDWHWVTNKGEVEMNPASIRMLGCGSVRFITSGRRKCAIDIFQLEPWLHLRLQEDRFRVGEAQGLDGFPSSGPDCSAAEAMRNLAQRLADEAPLALATGAFQSWIDPAGDPLPRHFHDVETYDSYNRWRLLVRARRKQ